MESTDDEVAALLDELDRAELVRLVHGALDPEGTATGYLPGVERLDVPPLRFVDGPLGVRIPDRRATAFPAPLALAASFDPSLARSQGAAMGREAAAHGQDVLLGPGTNLIRVPHGGRNFEYFSEDPVHSAAFAAAVVEGVQSEDVLACVKHYVANNQETDRATVDVRVGEQPLRELYLPAFRAAVDAGAGAVMSGYNSVNGTPMSEHGRLLGDVLKGEWGFEGFVVSDWFGTTDSVRSANGGLDVEMPGVTGEELASLMGMDEGGPDVDFDELGGGMPDMRTAARFETELAADVEAGDVSADRLADMAGRVLSQMASVGRLDGERPDGALDTDEHRALAERVAVRGTVLLANDGVLPLDDEADVAVVGPNVDEALLGGGGSSEVTPFVSSTPVEGVTERAGGEVTVAHGVEPVADLSFFEETEPPADADSSVEDAAAAAADADVAVVFVRDRATEAMDRPDLRLPGRQDELVSAVADANDRTVVVVNSSGPVELPWREDVAAVVENWYPGQAHGDAAAAVLYGDSDPGGRLPVSFAAESAYPTTASERFPGEDGVVEYSEGCRVGYRHFEASDDGAVYPFGHGESYASFAYRGAEQVDASTVRATVANTAERPGREVVQAYVRPADDANGDAPVRDLAGFQSVHLDAGEAVTVEVTLANDAFRRYEDGWQEREGPFVVELARSAGDVRATVPFERP
ncbi:glycoside hydrolase domain protein [Halobacterium hubeiense]|uniref:Glycoside hydrolase domain protein n=1 Tax=Halobacterium hubeiense TaxID=1407499 RepID=A0A0U5H002_9EURY|nr:glycoside hydrolase family 3 C-terminal domain-containing protein [Halobacterium hubeiense]CQH52072.1 glycoside hydrolase domain protein [Halobacterium hubeiense]